MVIVDGKKIAEKIKEELKKEVAVMNRKIRLAIIEVGEDKISQKFVSQKKRFAAEIGIDVREYKFPADISTNKLRDKIAEIVHIKQNTGVIIQLPLPNQLNVQHILNSVPVEKDVDLLSSRAVGDFATGKSKIYPPVVAGLEEVFKEYKIDIGGKTIVLVGAGRLVGKPIGLYFLQRPITLIIASESTENLQEITQRGDVIISGVGKPKLISGKHIKKGAVVIDFGADVDFESVKEKADLITPVPGGMGPIVVACVFKNLLALTKNCRKN